MIAAAAAVERVVSILRKESKLLVSKSSPFVINNFDDLLSFTIDDKVTALEKRAPILTTLLRDGVIGPIAPSKRYSKRSYDLGLFCAISVLIFLRSERACFLQWVVSLILFANGASKRVYSLLYYHQLWLIL